MTRGPKVRPYDGPAARPHGTLPGTLGRVLQAFQSPPTSTSGPSSYRWLNFVGSVEEAEAQHILETILNRFPAYRGIDQKEATQ